MSRKDDPTGSAIAVICGIFVIGFLMLTPFWGFLLVVFHSIFSVGYSH